MPNRPKPAEIRDELRRALDSSPFRSAHRSRQFLRYIVDEALAGRADQLKGYSIAIDVFGRSEQFDASSDPLVRVEASRVRNRLAEYYLAEGREAPLRITIPRGSYAPRFNRVRTGHRSLRHHRSGQLLTGAALAAALLTIVLAAPWTSGENARTSPGVEVPAAGTPVPRIAVSGFRNLTGSSEHDDFVAGLNAETMTRLSDFGLPVIAVQTHLDDGAAAGVTRPLRDAAARYVLDGSVRQAGEMVRISPRLIDPTSGEQVWSASFDEALVPGENVAIQESVGTRIAAILSNPFGPMYAQEASKLSAATLEDAGSYECVVQFRAYAKSLDPAAHERSRSCFLHVIAEGPQPAQIWAGLALVYLHEFWYSYNPQAGDPLDRAYHAAQIARSIDDRNLLANLAVAEIDFSKGDMKGFRHAAHRSLSLTRNAATLAQIGLLYTLAGDVEHGRRLLDEARAADLAIPSWYNVADSFNALLRGDNEEALEAALGANTPGWFPAPLAVAAAAGRTGQTELAAYSIERLLEIDPSFSQDGDEQLRKWIKSPELIECLMEGLKAGGLEVADTTAATAAIAERQL